MSPQREKGKELPSSFLFSGQSWHKDTDNNIARIWTREKRKRRRFLGANERQPRSGHHSMVLGVHPQKYKFLGALPIRERENAA
jgi:hypothetical protein